MKRFCFASVDFVPGESSERDEGQTKEDFRFLLKDQKVCHAQIKFCQGLLIKKSDTRT